MAKNKKNKKKEVDFFVILDLIEKGALGIYNFFNHLLVQAFHFIILLILFLRSHILKVAAAFFIGAILGFLLERTSVAQDRYFSDMIIAPKYNSVTEIREDFQFYNELIKRNDSVKLAEIFDLSFDEIGKLWFFELVPHDTPIDIRLQYNDFIKGKDSTIVKETPFRIFNDPQYKSAYSKRYVIRIYTKEYELDTLIQGKIIENIENNKRLVKKRDLALEELVLKKRMYYKSLASLDSLRESYKKIQEKENVKRKLVSGGTLIDFTKETTTTNNDLKLFNLEKSINTDLISLVSEKGNKDEVIEVVTDLKPMGKYKRPFTSKKWFVLGSILASLTLLIILLRMFNNYLIGYKNKHQIVI